MNRVWQKKSILEICAVVFIAIGITILQAGGIGAQSAETQFTGGTKATVGAYYFDGWAGRNKLAGDPKEPWAKNAPTHLTRRMIEEFPEREPLWGWRDDSLSVMERQIDLAADHGLSFFAFDWYWHDNGRAINKRAIWEDPLNLGLELFLEAKNNQRLKFCLLVANHEGYKISGTENWSQASDFLMTYFKHPQYLKVGGKPLVIIFHPESGDKTGFAYMQEAARKAGLPGIAIASCGDGESKMGYTHKTQYVILPEGNERSEAHPYAELMQAHRDAWEGNPEQPYFPLVMAGWDVRPWEGPTGRGQQPGWYFPDRTPEKFADLLREAISWVDQYPQQTTAERLILIYAWNEIGEGGYLVPTKGDPNGRYLDALLSVLKPAMPEAVSQ
jgi:hypothetical protein